MEGIPGNGMFPEMRPGMLGLEMPLHPSENPQNPHNPHHHLHPQQPQMMSYAHHEADHIHNLQQSQQALKHGQYPYAVATAAKPKQINLSDEDEPGLGPDDSDNKRKMSPWQRMKWTDTMVRLLIMAMTAACLKAAVLMCPGKSEKAEKGRLLFRPLDESVDAAIEQRNY